MTKLLCDAAVRRHIAHLLSDPLAESCCFLVGRRTPEGVVIGDAIETPNITRRDPEIYYAIGATTWQNAKQASAADGLEIIGHGHSHITGTPEPSYLDYRYIRPGEVGAVYHIRSGTLTWYEHAGTIGAIKIARSPLRRLIAFLLTD